MTPLVIDTETTIFKKGNPFADRNRLCYVGVHNNPTTDIWVLDGFNRPYGNSIRGITSYFAVHKSILWIGFNCKFDINWMRRYGILLSALHIWDCQLAEFIITGQQSPLPSLDDTCGRVGLAGKSGDIAERYWDKGIDTPDIPVEEMYQYLTNDCKITWELYQWQVNYLKDKPKLKRLIWNACQDLKLTAEMEYNGILYDLQSSKELGDQKLERIADIDRQLDHLVGRPSGQINWNSGDQLSAVLYGGTILVDAKEQYTFEYKDGRTAIKTRNVKLPDKFEQLVEPLKNSKSAKDGIYLTNEGVLRKLPAKGKAKQIVLLVLERTKIDTQVNRYLHGIPKLYDEMDWINGVIHGQLQHCTAKTGRLASSKPNIQNLDEEALRMIKTRFT